MLSKESIIAMIILLVTGIIAMLLFYLPLLYLIEGFGVEETEELSFISLGISVLLSSIVTYYIAVKIFSSLSDIFTRVRGNKKENTVKLLNNAIKFWLVILISTGIFYFINPSSNESISVGILIMLHTIQLFLGMKIGAKLFES